MRLRQVVAPVTVTGDRRRPVSGRLAKRARLRRASLEHSDPCRPRFGECRVATDSDEVAQQQQVDDVSGAVVDRLWWLVRVGDRMELLGDLEPNGDANQCLGVGQSEAAEWGSTRRPRSSSRAGSTSSSTCEA